MAGWPNDAKINSLTFDVSSCDTLFWFHYLIIVFVVVCVTVHLFVCHLSLCAKSFKFGVGEGLCTGK